MQQENFQAHSDPVGALLAGYQRLNNVPDELLAEDGTIRPVWMPLLQNLAGLSPEARASRLARGDQYLRDAGVFYRQYGKSGSAERDWPLSHIPVVIHENEWAEISEGLSQRADILESVAADFYGANRLVADGHLPPELLADNPEWLRTQVGVRPRSGHFLHFIAFDIGRGPKGKWWVIGDRTQAPSGAGFALETRMATTRIYAELYARSNVKRLAGYFRNFRDALLDLRENDGSRVGILTPGPLNDTYYEHAYIARYLGFMLLEGEDLTVRNGELMVRTVAGLRPISVLWRRLDARWADPLELEEASQLGTPGMLGAIRSGKVTMVNALGSGVLETRALLAFMPRIARALTGEELKLPNIATWWCGQEKEREFVKANAANMTIGKAFTTRLLFDLDDISAVGGTFNRDIQETVEGWIDHGAGQLVGQEAVSLSTAPAFDGGNIVPRPMSLRVFLTRTSKGWDVMPGGFARIGRSGDSAALAMQHGGSVADVWIVSDNPVSRDTMLSPPSAPFVRQQPGVLPSRAADNLYWLGRYVERSENAIRLLRAYHTRLAESQTSDTPILDYIEDHLETFNIAIEDPLSETVGKIIASATSAAAQVRDRFSQDGWLALNDLARTVEKMSATATQGDDMARAMGILLRKLSGFSGLVHENMYRFTGWRFLNIGRALERATSVSMFLVHFADPEAPEGSLDIAVELADSTMSHRRRYAVSTNRETVIDLLALDPLNPRSVLHQFNDVAEHIEYLPNIELHRQMTPLQRSMLQSQSSLAVMTPEMLGTAELEKVCASVHELSDHLSHAYLR